MRILITGITGFVGSHLAQYMLRVGGHTVAGLVRSNWQAWRYNDVAIFPADLGDPTTYANWLGKYRPEWVFHLAGSAATHLTEAEYRTNNIDATRYLYQELMKLPHRPRVLFTSTGLVYGSAESPDVAFQETDPPQATKPYPLSKIAGEKLSMETGLQAINVRLFNQLGPEQTTDYVVPKYAKKIALAEKNHETTLPISFLESTRDFTDIRDMVRALDLLMQHGTPGETYNAGTGQSVRIREVILRMAKMARHPLEIVEGELNTPDHVKADVSKLKSVTGWQPTISLDQTLQDVLDYWRSEV
jgi:GDP-4-dehydro-6-deoxy-D-mannose reductase